MVVPSKGRRRGSSLAGGLRMSTCHPSIPWRACGWRRNQNNPNTMCELSNSTCPLVQSYATWQRGISSNLSGSEQLCLVNTYKHIGSCTSAKPQMDTRYPFTSYQLKVIGGKCLLEGLICLNGFCIHRVNTKFSIFPLYKINKVSGPVKEWGEKNFWISFLQWSTYMGSTVGALSKWANHILDMLLEFTRSEMYYLQPRRM